MRNIQHDSEVLKYYQEQLYTTLFIDGNHENFTLLNSYPVEIWNNGKVHPINEKVIHLMRGQVFFLDGLSIFTFGGGLSIDKAWRTPGFDWWAEEEPSEEECREAIQNLKKYDYKIDYIVTHAAPRTIVKNYLKNAYRLIDADCETEKFLNSVLVNTDYKRWYCGHYHFDSSIPDCKMYVLYDRVMCLETAEEMK